MKFRNESANSRAISSIDTRTFYTALTNSDYDTRGALQRFLQAARERWAEWHQCVTGR